MAKRASAILLSGSVILASTIVRVNAIAIQVDGAGSRQELVRLANIDFPSVDATGLYVDCSWSSGALRAYEYRGRTADSWGCRKVLNFTSQNKKRTIACIGDSITQGLGVPGWEAYPRQLHGLLHSQYNVVNLGVADTVAQRLSYLGGHSYWGLPHWRKVVPNLSRLDIAIVQLGTNDAKTTNWNETAYGDDYLRMLRELRRMHPKATIITSVPPPVSRLSYDVQPEVVNHHLRKVIEDARRSAHLKGPPVDMQAAFASAAASAGGLYLRDQLHPSTAGHAIIARVLAAAVARLDGA